MAIDWQDTRLQEKADRVQRTIWALRDWKQCDHTKVALCWLSICRDEGMLDDPDLQGELSGIISELTDFGT